MANTRPNIAEGLLLDRGGLMLERAAFQYNEFSGKPGNDKEKFCDGALQIYPGSTEINYRFIRKICTPRPRKRRPRKRRNLKASKNFLA